MRIYQLIAIVVLAVLLSACGQPDTAQNEHPTSTAVLPSQMISSMPTATDDIIVGEYVTARSLRARVARSQVVVIGQVTDTGEVINMARNIYDNTKPASDTFGVGQVYHFQVQQYLKGSGPSMLNVVVPEGIIFKDPSTITAADIQQAKAVSPYEQNPLQTGMTYLLLLERLDGFDPASNYFTGGIHPWKFVVANDGSVTMDAPGGAILQMPPDFIPDPNAPLLPQIKQIIQDQQAGTP